MGFTLDHDSMSLALTRRPLLSAQAAGALPDVLDLQPGQHLLPAARHTRQGRRRHPPVGTGAAAWLRWLPLPRLPWCPSVGPSDEPAALGPSYVGAGLRGPGLGLLRATAVARRLGGAAALRERPLARRAAGHAQPQPKPCLAQRGGGKCGRGVSPPPRRADRAAWRRWGPTGLTLTLTLTLSLTLTLTLSLTLTPNPNSLRWCVLLSQRP